MRPSPRSEKRSKRKKKKKNPPLGAPPLTTNPQGSGQRTFAIMGMGRRPSPTPKGISPPRGVRLSSGEYRDNRTHERENDRNRNIGRDRDIDMYRDRDQDQVRSRSRSRSPCRLSDRHRPERYDPVSERVPGWNNYRPDYGARDKVIAADQQRKYPQYFGSI
jgi:hypothetical protein